MSVQGALFTLWERYSCPAKPNHATRGSISNSPNAIMAFVLLVVRIHDYCFHRCHWSACGQDGLRKFDTIQVVFHGKNERVEVFGPLRRLKGNVLEFASNPTRFQSEGNLRGQLTICL